MAHKDDSKGTTESEFRVGMAGGGQRIFSVFNNFLARMLWDPTAARNITIPDTDGTLAILQNNGLELKSIAYASLPTTGLPGTAIAYVPNHPTAGATLVLWNGTAWSPVGSSSTTNYTPVPIRPSSDITIAVTSGITTTAQTANTLRAWHWEVKRTLTLIAVREEVTVSAAGTTFRLCLYADNGNLYPGTLIADSDVGTLDSGTNGVKASTFATQIVLTPGSYFLAINNSGTPTIRTIPASSLSTALGALPNGGTSSMLTCYSIARAFGAMPATFPSGATLVGNVPAPLAMFRHS